MSLRLLDNAGYDPHPPIGIPTMQWIDGHLDLAYLAVNGRDLTRPDIDPASGCITLPAMREAGITTAFATIFTEPVDVAPANPEMYRRDDVDSAEAAGLRQLAVYERWHATGEIALLHAQAGARFAGATDAPGPTPSQSKIQSRYIGTKSKMAIVLLMEGADPIRSPDHVPFWFARGLRIVGLTWAAGTRYAGGNSSKPGEDPLTPLGIEMIRALDDAGIIHDVSHLSDAAFDGLMQYARGKIIASHSNCRALLDPNNQRHLRDDQIRAIAKRGGVIGLNLYSKFLAVGRRATIADCVAHVEHVAEIMGHCGGVALGSDMDGGFTLNELPIGLDHPSKLPALADALHDAGWSDEEVRGFASENWRRALDVVRTDRSVQ